MRDEERMVERDERGREIGVCIVFSTPKWTKHINNLLRKD